MKFDFPVFVWEINYNQITTTAVIHMHISWAHISPKHSTQAPAWHTSKYWATYSSDSPTSSSRSWCIWIWKLQNLARCDIWFLQMTTIIIHNKIYRYAVHMSPLRQCNPPCLFIFISGGIYVTTHTHIDQPDVWCRCAFLSESTHFLSRVFNHLPWF